MGAMIASGWKLLGMVKFTRRDDYAPEASSP